MFRKYVKTKYFLTNSVIFLKVIQSLCIKASWILRMNTFLRNTFSSFLLIKYISSKNVLRKYVLRTI
jgi:hypothetical protein